MSNATMTAPFTLLADAVRQHGSPLWAYDAGTIAERVEQLKVFDTVRFAQKANPNLHVPVSYTHLTLPTTERV